jgi:Cu+-exporting ATPase
MFNFWGTITVDTLGIGLAFFGLLAPIIAALIHVGSELAFILNSARLFRSPVDHEDHHDHSHSSFRP